MNKIIKYALFMFIIGCGVSLLLSVVNEITSPIIEKRKLEKVEISLKEVDDTNNWIASKNNEYTDQFIEDSYYCIDESNNKLIVCYLINTKGYSNGNIESLIFIDFNTKKIIKVKILNIENQTKGIGSLILDDENYVKVYENVSVKKYKDDDINKHTSNSVDIISGATISSRGVVQAVISACNNFIQNEVE